MKVKSDVGGQGQRKSGQLCLVLVRPDRQTPDRVFLKIRTKSGHRTESRQTESGQTDIGQDFLQNSGQNPDRIRTADRHRTGFSGKSGQKRDTDRTRTVLSADVCYTGCTVSSKPQRTKKPTQRKILSNITQNSFLFS